MNILITGGNSFIAQSFIAYQQSNFAISKVVRSKTGSVNEIIVPDLFELPDSIFKGIDVVIHTAAIVHKGKSVSKEMYDLINAKLPVVIARKAKQAGIKQFVQLSTVSVYGELIKINEQSETYPTTVYGKTKLEADMELLKLQDAHFQVAIVRPPMVYGGINPPGNLQRLVRLVKTGIPLPFANANNKRDFVHVRNLVGIIEKVVLGKKSGVYLASDNFPVSTREIIDTIKKVQKVNTLLFPIPDFVITVLRKIVPRIFEKLFGELLIDISGTIHRLSYTPQFTMQHGLEEMNSLQ